jgi:hypothetical protein
MVPATPYSGTLIVLYSLIIPGIEIMIAALGTLLQDVRYGLRTFFKKSWLHRDSLFLDCYRNHEADSKIKPILTEDQWKKLEQLRKNGKSRQKRSSGLQSAAHNGQRIRGQGYRLI